MDSAFDNFLTAMPQAAFIWVAILLLLAVAVVTSALPRFHGAHPVEENPYADEIENAATRAAATAVRRRAEWLAAQETVDSAWTAYEEADRAARRTSAATAYPLISRRRKPGENVDRQRYLHRAAGELCRSQDLSIAQLNDVYAHRGWNPRLHPVQQEPLLRNAARDHRLTAYRRSVEAERIAWRAAEAAADEVRSLRAEASSARMRGPAAEPIDQQWWSEQWAATELPAAA
ncbi:hypothetical protein [Actinoplanes rectilineatus]|uniref:hypothetical protein n=1 Tax=Actinoplanes rectilineatus TaxID=113571 RepID=UPI0005F2CF7D|nr:hypothetical protein [Actinoplanes rectilineatus]